MLLLTGIRAKTAVDRVRFSPDGSLLASTSDDGTVRLWDLATGAGRVLLDDLYLRGMGIDFSPDGETLVWAGALSGYVHFTARPFTEIQGYQIEGFQFVSCLEFSPNGRSFAVTAREGIVLIESQTVACQSKEAFQQPISLAFSPDGRWLVVGRARWRRDNEYTLHFLDAPTLVELRPAFILSDVPDNLAFSPDGRYLAVSCRRRVRVLKLPAVEQVGRLEVDRRHFTAIAFTPDGRFLTAARSDGTVQFYETGTWREAAAFDWGIGPLTCLAIARDGMRAAVGSKKGTILVWDVDL